MRGADRWRRAALLNTASQRIWGVDRSAIVVDRSKTLLGKGMVRAGAGPKYIFAQSCCLGAIQRLSAWLQPWVDRQSVAGRCVCRAPFVSTKHACSKSVRGLNLPKSGFDTLVDTNETAPTYKYSPISLVNKKLK